MRCAWLCTLLGSALLAEQIASAQEAPAPGFDVDVLPLFVAKCVECHSPRKRSGKLNLASALGVARGGENGGVVVPGNLEQSRLWQRIVDQEMPPDEPLAESEQAIVRHWISSGAHGLPPADQAGRAGDGADHWAFQPPRRPGVPTIRDASRVRNDVDHFIQASLEEKGLSLSSEAGRLTLIRRVSFDLVGLPPTPAEIATFVTDASVDAYERMVERYLTSPHYGERWGRHWLDAAGYAESNGHFSADTERPLAYRYRDYVIRAFNEDRSFDRFVTEQLAGDELADYRPDCDILPDQIDLYAATHFLRNSQDGTDSSDGNPDELLLDRYTVLEGTVQNIGACLLGLTLQCARCHDHKFEPISQKEYYQLQAIFFPGYCPDQWVKAADRTVTVATQAQREAHAKRTAELNSETESLRERLAETARPLARPMVVERLAGLPEAERNEVLAAFDKPEKDRTPQEKKLLKAHKDQVSVDEGKLAEQFSDFAALKKSIDEQIARLEKQRPAALEKIAVFTEVSPEPPRHHVLLRGQYRQPGDEAGPGVPAVLCSADQEERERQYVVPAKNGDRYSSGRRLALARWLTSRQHPTFARVGVNRIWQHHFGTGIVATADNFGYTGSEPSHPALLDYLASVWIDSGWSTKAIHRLILNSATYRQDSQARDEALAIDPKNQLLSRYPLRRLDAEAIRDAMLAASGELDSTMFGPSVPTVRQADGSVIVKEQEAGALRRSVYLQQRRSQLSSLLEVFDAPSMVGTCPRRTTSTVALQSLSLLNSDFVLARASALAGRIVREAGPQLDDRLSRAFLLTLGRSPTEDERKASREFVESQAAVYSGRENGEQLVWRDLAQMLFASNAFLYVE